MFSAIWAVIKGLSLGPALGKGVLWLFNKIKAYWKIAVPVLLVLVLAYVAWHYVHGLKGQISDLQRTVNAQYAQQIAMENALYANRNAFDECVAINQANTEAFLAQMERADKAEQRIAALTERSNDEIEDINDESNELRGRDEDCRSLDDPLPDWFDNWLRE